MGSTDEKEEYTYENEEREELTEERILQMLDERKFKELKEELEHMYPVDLVELIMAMEEEFDVGEVAEDDLAELKTVGDWVNYLAGKLK